MARKRDQAQGLLFDGDGTAPPPDGTTVFSPCRTWRYTLGRSWEGGSGVLVVIGLNPSTADETKDDPTIRRCIDFAKRWGFARLGMLNLFAFRATEPADMKAAPWPIGPDNDRHLKRVCQGAGLVLAAWGVHGIHQGRSAAVYRALTEAGVTIQCLGLSKDGHPRHPLYMPKDSKPRPFIHP